MLGVAFVVAVVSVVLAVVCCWSTALPPPEAVSFALPGLLFRSTLLAVPAAKSDWLVSVKQALVVAAVSAKSCTVVLFWVMETLFAVAVL